MPRDQRGIVKSEQEPITLVECSNPRHSSIVNKLENQANGFGRDDVQLVEMSHEVVTMGGRDLALPSQAVVPMPAEVESRKAAAKQTGAAITAIQEEQQATFVQGTGLTAEQLATVQQQNHEDVHTRLNRRCPAPGEV